MPLTITPLPVPVPSSTDPLNFSARGDATFGAFPTLISETNALASEQAANRDIVIQNRIDTETAEENAAGFALAASVSEANSLASSSAQLWVSGTTYSVGTVVYSPITASTYRRKIAGAGTTNPSLDSTNWYPVILDASTNYPVIQPTLNLDFANRKSLDPRVTFTRASTATYYDGVTQAKAEENLLKYSQDFDNAAWTPTADITISTNATTAPDGTATADKLIATTNTALHGSSQGTINSVGTAVTISVFAKAAEYNYVVIVADNTQSRRSFNLGSGTVGMVGGLPNTATIQAVGNGWYRCTMTFTPTAAFRLNICVSDVDSGLPLFAGDGTSGIFVWGAQLEQRSQATAYTPTTSSPITKYQPVLQTAASGVPRFDHDPATGESMGLLIEEQRANLLTWGSALNWSVTNVTKTPNVMTCPDGTVGATLIKATAGAYANRGVYQATTVTAGATYTTSVYAKAGTYGLLFCGGAGFNLNAGTVTAQPAGGSASMVHVGNGWYRCIATSVAASTTAWTNIFLDDGAGAGAMTANGSETLYIWGAQLEAGSFATSYIPTTSTAVTRQADVASITGTNFSSWYRADEGTCLYRANSYSQIIPPFAYAISDNTSSNRIVSLNSTFAHLYCMNAGVVQADLDAGNISVNTFNSVAGTYKLNSFSACINSGTVSQDTTGTIPTVNRIFIGSNENGSANFLNGTMKRFVYYPKQLSNQELQAITS